MIGLDGSILSVGECMVEFFRDAEGHWRQGFAGDTLNVAWGLRALLPNTIDVGYLTRFGDDPFSGRALAFLAENGIGTAAIRRETGLSIGLYTIETDPRGERSFAYWRGQSAARRLADDGAALASAFGASGLVYLSGITLAILSPEARTTLLAALGARGSRRFAVAFDPNLRPRLWEDGETMRRVVMQAAQSADIVLPSFDDEAGHFGDADPDATIARYRSAGVPDIIVKNGEAPVNAHADGATIVCPVTPVRPVDTTGAGDSFNAGYLAARRMGRTLTDCVALGQSVSAMVVGTRGALVPMDRLSGLVG